MKKLRLAFPAWLGAFWRKQPSISAWWPKQAVDHDRSPFTYP
jgi:hypothetical protein